MTDDPDYLATWRPVVGYEGIYEVSNDGRVRSLARTITKRNRWGGCQDQRIPERVLGGFSRNGYSDVSLSRGGKSQFYRVHRLLLEAFVGPCPDGMLARHLNGKRSDNRLANLRWGTPSENNYDSVAHGTNHNANRTHCRWGHPLVHPNLDPSTRRRRRCRSCALAGYRAKAALREGRPYDRRVGADQILARLQGGWVPSKGVPQERCKRGHRLGGANLKGGVEGGCLSCGRAHAYSRYLRSKGKPDPGVVALADHYYEKLGISR